MRDKIEAVLFAAGRFLDEDYIAKLLQEDIRKVRKALEELRELYSDRGPQTSLRIVQEERSWKIQVKDEYLELISKLVSEKEIATTVLETLAIIAWRNPAMQAELIKIRGPAAYEHVNELIERGFITKEPSGRSFKLKVTDKFFDYFDVEGRDDLRKLFKATEEKAAAQQAEVEKHKAEYEMQKKVAAAVQKAHDEGKELSPEELEKLKASLSAGTSHSAQTAPLPSKEEIDKVTAETGKDIAAEEADEELADGQKSADELVREIRGEIGDMKKDLDDLREAEALAKRHIKEPKK